MSENIKEKIVYAFLEMTDKKGIDKITIKDLVEKCGISRQAFYYHFRDILDVIEYILQKSADHLMEQCLTAPSIKDALNLFVDFSIDNNAFIHRLLDSRQRANMENLIFQCFRNYMEDIYRQKASEIPINYCDFKVALDFYTHGIAGLLMENINQNTFDRALLADQMYRLLGGQITLFPASE